VIKFTLQCDGDHQFEGWYKSSDDFETQQKRGFLECPVCGSSDVAKALMAPSVSTSRKREEVAVAIGDARQREIMTKMRELARELKKNSVDVGEKFAEEARKIHYGEADPRGIYGKATKDEVVGLVEEGVGIMPLPDLPEDLN
jgi:hypothetical protein